eukprot:CAMPEP_0202706580 /NCGR_PEP_ID=MMETSP1385-20130828/18983_1 /ASSEMBLY_ACC=CAM_ASM_000861 /TAXON_ID=933848 /ORGANISM="Elphidium margaritaceum" /LENGTH=70 /DNA_ID=CAMNT_0049365083 /DNA_START=101 /DNA_END=313 /DNA_ORIENTATION=-
MVEKGVVFNMMFPDAAEFQTLHFCQVAKIKMYLDQYPMGIELIFIGAGNHWFLNPLQNALMLVEQRMQNE